jgi:transcriptional regulator with XRE-family HTH domain
MKNTTTESTREMLLALIEAEYESDAAFERALGLAEKTVNNWRRGRSASFMKMLPTLSERFGIHVGALMDIPLKGESAELSEEELHLLHLYRKSRTLPKEMRAALIETVEQVIGLYLKSAEAITAESGKKRKTSTKGKEK